MSRFKRANIGSISTGLTPEGFPISLIQTFIAELHQQPDLHARDRALINGIELASAADLIDTKVTRIFIDKLVTALSGYAPKGYFFGPNPADPADFGYWPEESHGRNEGKVEAEERQLAQQDIALTTAEAYATQQRAAAYGGHSVAIQDAVLKRPTPSELHSAYEASEIKA